MAKAKRFAAVTLLALGTLAVTWVQPAGAVGQPVDADSSGWLTVAHVSPVATPAGQDLSLEVQVHSSCVSLGFGVSCDAVGVELHYLALDGSEVVDTQVIGNLGLLTVGTADFTVPAAALAPPTFSYWFRVAQTKTSCAIVVSECSESSSEVRAPRIGSYVVAVVPDVS